MAKHFPEKDRSELRPDNMAPCYHRNSESIEDGHEEFDSRMPHPFRDSYAPNKESGEGKNA